MQLASLLRLKDAAGGTAAVQLLLATINLQACCPSGHWCCSMFACMLVLGEPMPAHASPLHLHLWISTPQLLPTLAAPCHHHRHHRQVPPGAAAAGAAAAGQRHQWHRGAAVRSRGGGAAGPPSAGGARDPAGPPGQASGPPGGTCEEGAGGAREWRCAGGETCHLRSPAMMASVVHSVSLPVHSCALQPVPQVSWHGLAGQGMCQSLAPSGRCH